METLETLKQEISTLADARQERSLRRYVAIFFENPELAFQGIQGSGSTL